MASHLQEHALDVITQIVDRTHRDERIGLLEQIEVIAEVAQYHLAVLDVPALLLPGILQPQRLLVALALYLKGVNLSAAFRQ